jgi:hypothetical protein
MNPPEFLQTQVRTSVVMARDEREKAIVETDVGLRRRKALASERKPRDSGERKERKGGTRGEAEVGKAGKGR